MARRTDGEKIDELEKTTAEHAARLIQLERAIEDLTTQDRQRERELVETRMAAEREIALLKQTCDELSRWTERNGTSELEADLVLVRERATMVEATQEKAAGRAWAVVPNVAGAVVNGLLAGGVAYLVARR